MAAVAASVLMCVGCHSSYVEATLQNHTAQPISLVELDYPSASFGVQSLAPNAEYHYRFMILGSGNVKFLYTDAKETEHTASGPARAEGDEGTLIVALTSAGVTWAPALHKR